MFLVWFSFIELFFIISCFTEQKNKYKVLQNYFFPMVNSFTEPCIIPWLVFQDLIFFLLTFAFPCAIIKTTKQRRPQKWQLSRIFMNCPPGLIPVNPFVGKLKLSNTMTDPAPSKAMILSYLVSATARLSIWIIPAPTRKAPPHHAIKGNLSGNSAIKEEKAMDISPIFYFCLVIFLFVLYRIKERKH